MDNLGDPDDVISQFKSQIQATRDLKTDLERRIEEARLSIAELVDVQRVLRFLFERVNQPGGDTTTRLVTAALQNTFSDEDLILHLEESVKNGRPAIAVKIHDRRRGVIADPMEAAGGGPRYLIGILLRVLTIVRQPSLKRILILDEPLKEVSRRYHGAAIRLLRQLCEPEDRNGLGFSMLVVTHDESIKSAAHRSYRASVAEDGVSLQLDFGDGQDFSYENESDG